MRVCIFTGAGLGAVARTFIRPYTWLAEYEGEIHTPDDIKDLVRRHADDDNEIVRSYAFTVSRNHRSVYSVDASRVETSNWLRWLNCPRTRHEENVRYVQCHGKVFFVTTRWVLPGEELLVYYGDSYAQWLGIDPRKFRHY